MRRIPVIIPAFAVAAAVASTLSTAVAKPVTSPEELSGATVNVTFAEVRTKDKLAFGSSEVGQPYSKLGLVLPSQMIDASVKLTKDLDVAVKSTGVSTVNNSNFQSLAFTTPQRVVGFNVKSERATSITVTALDRSGNVVGETVLQPSTETQFVGFALDEAKITVVRIVAPHATMGDALMSPTFISGIQFGALGEGETESGLAAGVGLTSDLSLASAVGSPGGGGANAFASAGGGFGGGGTGSAGNFGAGRNPGNRNPNLPPAIIPEPATFVAGAGAAILLLRRRRTA